METLLGLTVERRSTQQQLMATDNFFGKKILLTGHTGFKGSWLRFLLSMLGAQIIGLSNNALTEPNLHEFAPEPNDNIVLEIDRESKELENILKKKKPDLIIHLAGQAILRNSLTDPYQTFSSNTIGTLNLLEAFRKSSRKALLVITSDKCYENKEGDLLKEVDRLGGSDPYSASKAAAEIICESYNSSYFQNAEKFMATARAGNVVGGGDWSAFRLIPDIVRSIKNKEELSIRMPQAVRPWQHVLDALNGYLLLASGLMDERAECCSSFNFGPNADDILTVQQILDLTQKKWPKFSYKLGELDDKKEVQQLRLDNSKAKQILDWQCKWSCEQAVEKTIDWYQSYQSLNNTANLERKREVIKLCQKDLQAFGIKQFTTK